MLTDCPKVRLDYEAEIKDHLFFSTLLLLNCIFTILSHYLIPSFSKLHNSILSFCSELLSVLFALFQRSDLFYKKNSVKTAMNSNPKVQYPL